MKSTELFKAAFARAVEVAEAGWSEAQDGHSYDCRQECRDSLKPARALLEEAIEEARKENERAKVYVLVNDHGDYSDYRKNVLGVYADRDKAQKVADELNARVARMQESNNAVTGPIDCPPGSTQEEMREIYLQALKRCRERVRENYPDIFPFLDDDTEFFDTDNAYSVEEHEYHA